MNNDLSRKWYMAKDIKNILGISSGQLFHWGQTWGLIKPKIKAKGRAFKDKYLFINLLDIALIKELNEMGFEPSKIKYILKPFEHPDAPKKWRGSIWNFFKDGREDREEYFEETGKTETIHGYDKAGCLILMSKSKRKYSLDTIDTNNVILGFMKHRLKDMKMDVPTSSIIINLLKIVRELEEKTGEKL